MNRFQFRTILRNDRPRKDGSLGVYVYAKINGKTPIFPQAIQYRKNTLINDKKK